MSRILKHQDKLALEKLLEPFVKADDVDEVLRILSVEKDRKLKSDVLRSAVCADAVELTETFFPMCGEHYSLLHLIDSAAGAGASRTLNLLLSKVSPFAVADDRRSAFDRAISNGRSNVVRDLLPFMDKDSCTKGLVRASKRLDEDCVFLLLPFADANGSLNELHESPHDGSADFLLRCISVWEKEQFMKKNISGKGIERRCVEGL